ncbi:hypothetical protein ACJX0J_038170 [Zea mays]
MKRTKSGVYQAGGTEEPWSLVEDRELSGAFSWLYKINVISLFSSIFAKYLFFSLSKTAVMYAILLFIWTFDVFFFFWKNNHYHQNIIAVPLLITFSEMVIYHHMIVFFQKYLFFSFMMSHNGILALVNIIKHLPVL